MISTMFTSRLKRPRQVLVKAAGVLLVTVIVLFCCYQTCFELLVLGHDVYLYKYSKDRPKYLCINLEGGLGNQLFQYAFAYSVSRQLNRTLVCQNTLLHELQKVFRVSNCVNDYRGYSICYNSYPYTNYKDMGYDEEVVSHDFGTDDVYLEGYYQSWKYWDQHEDEIRREYTLSNDLRSTALRILNDVSDHVKSKDRSKVTRVGIHIRRGNMLDTFFSKFGYEVATKDYILKAMSYMRNHLSGHIVFVVASNDMKWARETISDNSTVFLEGHSRNVDFAVMSMCDHFIMSVGTFGWWMGWQVKGIVLYYTKPFKPGTKLAGKFTSDYITTFFRKEWIGL